MIRLLGVLIFIFYCSCAGRNWYITEIEKENKNECREIIRERPYKNKLFKKVIYKIKKECRKKGDSYDRESGNGSKNHMGRHEPETD